MPPDAKTKQWYENQAEQDQAEREDDFRDAIRLLQEENKELKEEVSMLKLVIQAITRYFN
jgi:hypothetical protein